MISSGLARKPVGRISLNTASINITTGAWVELVAATSKAFSFLEVYNNTGRILRLAVGAAASESELLIYIYPGISSQIIPLDELVKNGDRLSVRALDGTANTGYLIMNMYA